MRKKYAYTFLLSAALTAGAAGVGFAADLPVKAPIAAPPPIAAPYSWAGFYIGANVGYAWGTSNFRATPLPQPGFGALPFTIGVDPEGFVGGIQAGYNWQAGNFVYGIEVDFQGTNIEDSTRRVGLPNGAGIIVPTWGSVAITTLDYFGTVRGRLGFTVTPELLIYATGGFAYGNVENRARTKYTPLPPFIYAGSKSELMPGWTAGGGFEYGFNQWSVKVEYLYVSLDSPNFVARPLAPNPPFRIRHNVNHLDFSVARVGLNYRFPLF